MMTWFVGVPWWLALIGWMFYICLWVCAAVIVMAVLAVGGLLWIGGRVFQRGGRRNAVMDLGGAVCQAACDVLEQLGGKRHAA